MVLGSKSLAILSSFSMLWMWSLSMEDCWFLLNAFELRPTSEGSSSEELGGYDFLVRVLRLAEDLRELLRYLSELTTACLSFFLHISMVAPLAPSVSLDADRIRNPLDSDSLGSLTQSCLYLAPCIPVALIPASVIFYYIITSYPCVIRMYYLLINSNEVGINEKDGLYVC